MDALVEVIATTAFMFGPLLMLQAGLIIWKDMKRAD